MKVRLGFVSNSSSSSFVLDKNKLTEYQINAIKNHATFWKKLPARWKAQAWGDEESPPLGQDEWEVRETDEELHLGTTMDNFDMGAFLAGIDVSMGAVKSQGDSFWGFDEDEEHSRD